MSEVKGATGQPPQWAPPKGLLQYVRVPGHAPGQMAFIHKPSASLLMADTIANMCGGFVQKQPPKLVLVPPGKDQSFSIIASAHLASKRCDRAHACSNVSYRPPFLLQGAEPACTQSWNACYGCSFS